MKGIILAGGEGTRLWPMTKVVNKHLLPVAGEPMIQRCIEKLISAGIADIMIVTGGEHLGGIAEFCGSGIAFGCRFTYRVQDKAGGIAEALKIAIPGFAETDDNLCVLLGDNIFQDSLRPAVDYWKSKQPQAMVMLSQVEDPKRFGVAEVTAKVDPDVFHGDSDRPVRSVADAQQLEHPLTVFRVNSIEEKPEYPKTNLAVTGIYFYRASSVMEIACKLQPSARGELEITDVNNEYAKRGELVCRFWEGWWTDAGTLESYRRANELAADS